MARASWAVAVCALLLVATAVSGVGQAVRAAKASPGEPTAPTVQLEKGAVRGTNGTSVGGRGFLAFWGIPYARPPVGKYRFREPRVAKPWQGVWDATRPPPKCMQYERYPVSAVLGDEDCLYLNVFTPKLPKVGAPLRDVLVWIHGGGFMYGGSPDFGPEIIMDRDVVFVTINYRVGPLGFLSTEDEAVPGNMGLKDQAAALRWLQGNVAAFGGNPNSVTLFGLSAGGASVHYQYLSPLSQGLFHRGWSLSGSAYCPWTQQEAARLKALRLAELVGCPVANATSRDVAECLRHRPARALAAAVPGLQDELELPFSPFAPVVEPAGTQGAFLEQSPAQTVRSGLAHDLPWITGITTEEGLYNAAEFLGPANAGRMEVLDKTGAWLEKAPLLLDYVHTVADAAQRDAVSNAIRERYLGERTLRQATKEFIAMVGDRIFNSGVEQAARDMAAANAQPVFLYQFGFRGLSSLSEYMAPGDTTDYGVSHGDDAGYLLKWEAVPTGRTEEERKVTQQLLSILTTFARTGVPSGLPGSPAWAPLDPSASDLHLLRVDRRAELSFTTVPEFSHTSFWTSLPLDENQDATESVGRDEL